MVSSPPIVFMPPVAVWAVPDSVTLWFGCTVKEVKGTSTTPGPPPPPPPPPQAERMAVTLADRATLLYAIIDGLLFLLVPGVRVGGVNAGCGQVHLNRFGC